MNVEYLNFTFIFTLYFYLIFLQQDYFMGVLICFIFSLSILCLSVWLQMYVTIWFIHALIDLVIYLLIWSGFVLHTWWLLFKRWKMWLHREFLQFFLSLRALRFVLLLFSWALLRFSFCQLSLKTQNELVCRQPSRTAILNFNFLITPLQFFFFHPFHITTDAFAPNLSL